MTAIGTRCKIQAIGRAVGIVKLCRVISVQQLTEISASLCEARKQRRGIRQAVPLLETLIVSEEKARSRSFVKSFGKLIGPPRFPPNWFLRRLGLPFRPPSTSPAISLALARQRFC
jgi:hypothetical protein